MQIVLPMETSFDVTYGLIAKKKHKDEIGDVRVYLVDAKKNVMAKTQLPIWDIPVGWAPDVKPEETVTEGEGGLFDKGGHSPQSV